MNDIQVAITKRLNARNGKPALRAWKNLWITVSDNDKSIKPLLAGGELNTDELIELFAAIEVLGLIPLYGNGQWEITKSVMDGKLDRPWVVNNE